MNFYLRFDLFDKVFTSDATGEIFKELKISCTHFGRNNLWIGDLEGIVYRFDKEFSSSMFIAYETCVNNIKQCKDNDILITSGIDSMTNDVVKFWDTSKWSKHNNPICLRSVTSTITGEIDFKVICFNVLNDLTTLVLGLGNRKIDLIYSGILVTKKSKRKLIYELPEQITTVTVNQLNDLLYVYVTTASRIVILEFNEQINDIKVLLDDETCACPKNSSILFDNVFVLANHKGIYEVYLGYIGPCRALDGDNICLSLYKHYLIVVKLVKSSVLMGTNVIKKTDQRSATSTYQIVIFDHVNRFIAGEFPLPDFNFLFIEWGSIYVYCGHPTNKVFVFTEKDVHSQLKIFFQKSSFHLAIDIAKSQNFDENALADMYRQYGDHLYKEKRYDEAIINYIKTIGNMEPSFVISQFLTTSQIPNLVKYLEVLVQCECCSAEHNILLLNCYIILKKQKELMEFIKNHKTVKFDVVNIFNLLRKVNLFDEALDLAKRYNEHDWYLKILINDKKQYSEAVEYISNLPLPQTEEALLNYGNKLINVEPEILVEQLERVCNKQSDSKINISTILKIFVNNRKGLKQFLSRYISKIKSTDENYSVYVDTLLELLLYEVEKEHNISEKSAEEVMEILQNDKLYYHTSKALVCCQIRGFTRGYRYLCEKKKKYLEILNSYKTENDIEGIMDTCRRFGSDEPTLWIKALEYLIEVNPDEKYFSVVIQEIESRSLISPLLLLEKMTIGNNSLKFGLVKEYVLRYYEKNEKLISEYQKEISKYKEETKKNNDLIQDLDTEIKIFQNLKCMICTSILDIPSVHFLCGHSYHTRCFESYSRSKNECLKCGDKIEDILGEINQWQSNKFDSVLDINTLSLEKLWSNVLKKSQHPISIDPDQFISQSFTYLSIESENMMSRTHSEINNSVPTKESTPVQTKINPATTPVSSDNAIPKSKIKPKVDTMERLMNASPDRQIPSAKTFSSQFNPFENSNENKHSVSSSKTTLNSITSRGSPVTSNTSKNDSQQPKNPFEEYIDTDGNKTDSSNPFVDYKSNDDKYPYTLNPFESD